MSDKRDLTPGELKALQLVKIFEEASDARKLTVTLHGSLTAAETIHKLETKYRLLRTLRVEYLQKVEKYAVTFALGEYRKYVECMLTTQGMALQVDGSIKTFDNYIIPNSYLDRG